MKQIIGINIAINEEYLSIFFDQLLVPVNNTKLKYKELIGILNYIYLLGKNAFSN